MDPFLGQLALFPYNRVPNGWARCDGTTLPINSNQALFSLLGYTFGGSGTQFALPDLRGRTPIGFDNNDPVGLAGGAENVTLTAATCVAHSHDLQASSNPGDVTATKDAIYAASPLGEPMYAAPSSPGVGINPNVVEMTGGGQGHNNVQPSTVLCFCIATTGYYPQRG